MTTKPLCPRCGTATLTSSDGPFCPRCWEPAHVPALQIPGALRVFDSIRPAEATPEPETYDRESELVQAIRAAFQARGWLVYCIGQHVVRGSGSDEGVPDMLVVKPACAPYPAVVRLLECKIGRNGATEAQQKLIDAGASYLVRSVREALEAAGEDIR